VKRFLTFFSYAFHPLVIPLYVTVFCIYGTSNTLIAAEKIVILLQVLIVTVLIPVAFFFLLRSMGKLQSIMAENVSQRRIPLMVEATLLALLVAQGMVAERLPGLRAFFFAAMISTLLALGLAMIKIKASLHMMGMGGFLFFAVLLSYATQANHVFAISGLLLVTGLVGTSRLEMKAHSGAELLLGFLCGAVPMAVVAALR
jgi:hypothetical protein